MYMDSRPSLDKELIRHLKKEILHIKNSASELFPFNVYLINTLAPLLQSGKVTGDAVEVILDYYNVKMNEFKGEIATLESYIKAINDIAKSKVVTAENEILLQQMWEYDGYTLGYIDKEHFNTWLTSFSADED